MYYHPRLTNCRLNAYFFAFFTPLSRGLPFVDKYPYHQNSYEMEYFWPFLAVFGIDVLVLASLLCFQAVIVNQIRFLSSHRKFDMDIPTGLDNSFIRWESISVLIYFLWAFWIITTPMYLKGWVSGDFFRFFIINSDLITIIGSFLIMSKMPLRILYIGNYIQSVPPSSED